MPTYLDRYETVRLLGQGIMGMVYLAWQKDLSREVVLKVMHDSVAADPKFRERFEREMQVMAKFQHPYAVTLHDASVQDPKGPFIVMEYVEGVTLEAVLKTNAPMHPARVGRMLYQILEVLHAAHGKGIIHRDLKPANIMVVEPDTPFEKIKVLDFGLAKMVGPAGWTPASVADLNLPGRMVHYLCPEMARGQGMDHRGDLYSVGVILFEMLTGKPPFAGESGAKVLMDHATKAAPSFAEVKAPDWTSSAIESVVRACLAKNPKNRPAGARDLAIMYRKALEQNKGVPEPPLEDSVPPRTTPELPPQPGSPTLTPPSPKVEPVPEPPPVTAPLPVDKVENKLQPIQNTESPPPLSATKPVISSDSPARVSRRPPTLEEIVIDENALVYHIETCLPLAAAELKSVALSRTRAAESPSLRLGWFEVTCAARSRKIKEARAPGPG
jgi:serine/threonine-protein kinase